MILNVCFRNFVGTAFIVAPNLCWDHFIFIPIGHIYARFAFKKLVDVDIVRTSASIQISHNIYSVLRQMPSVSPIGLNFMTQLLFMIQIKSNYHSQDDQLVFIFLSEFLCKPWNLWNILRISSIKQIFTRTSRENFVLWLKFNSILYPKKFESSQVQSSLSLWQKSLKWHFQLNSIYSYKEIFCWIRGIKWNFSNVQLFIKFRKIDLTCLDSYWRFCFKHYIRNCPILICLKGIFTGKLFRCSMHHVPCFWIEGK